MLSKSQTRSLNMNIFISTSKDGAWAAQESLSVGLASPIESLL